ncbi:MULTISPECIES: thioesterase domain-containing protein [Marinobacter]|jgi:thioesterase domain-containing protein|uniref:Thioesterase n=1 Tax=Marinobacter salarius TaxID=1420917 RepID=W5YXU6_9GAMM|nr:MULTISPECIES: thioesterase domain-containing protein [Marinobacter]MBL83911.1 thioesterase [Marinobacter sp.]AHI31143.1 thioesterase [Marinobacter salarius]ARM84483.1 putative thioesterase [Marinobacter salarius]AZR43307.1 galactoside O-acetyltransferase [Marinobacter salarius]MBJ7278239.1 thioesterase domain-containing protein [Marinobacter salarius]|tara:strand:+ start:656 stop:1141 length:486 start_codon:yes stop_codon:yes gene_type:complete|eukprot:GDKH01005076.1.p1 GENE.GDKH01005076.1~~GDKH01005076.1.p1  ORF type:complete len:171 (-),score=34.45 GDKH01005076.1:89-574(-)
MTQLARFQKRIYDMIPLSEALGVELVSYDGHALLVSAPLAPNHNHQGTGFGGSVYSVAVISAWGLVELVLTDLGLAGKVVIQVGEIEHIEPVDTNFFALCRLPGGEVPDRFRKSLARHGKGRLSLIAEVYCGEPTTEPVREPVAVFQGRFVVQGAHSRSVI